MSELLKVAGVSVSYGPIRALVDADLTVEAGELVAVLGANGAGKSTLLRAISGLVPAGGRVWVDGDSVERRPPHAIARLGVAHVPERRGTFAELSVEENLRVAAHALERRRARLEEVLDRVWSLFPALVGLRRRQAGSLSGGEQQMLAVGRGLMMDPRLLLLDEPSLGLAPRITAEIFAQIHELNRAGGIGVLLVEQNARMALGIADRGYVLQSGRIVLAGDARKLQGDRVVQSAYLAG